MQNVKPPAKKKDSMKTATKFSTVTLVQIRRAVKAEIVKALSERRRIHRRRPLRALTPEQKAKYAARRAKRRAYWNQRARIERAQARALRVLMRAGSHYMELMTISLPSPHRRARVNPL